ncbi:MAG: FAD-binding protein [Pseudomonadales bacterium]|nr:FAD-binding protein [Pseudomonadales bacterium]
MTKLQTLSFDGIIVGGGGAGMRAALQLAQSGYKTAVVSKVFPTRSHTVSAQGGITCAIGSDDPNDDWRWHMYDSVKGSDYIGDQDAIEYMCSVGPQAVFELEHMGLPFSRTETGRIYQRPFGGQSKDFGRGGQAARTCAAADRTGHALLHTLYQANLKNNAVFLNEWYAIDLVVNQRGQVVGVVALCIETGEMAYLQAKATVLATGGAGQVFLHTTNTAGSIGSGLAMASRAGARLRNVEYVQFHPTALYRDPRSAGRRFLISEAVRGEGARLVNAHGETFTERYDSRGDLAPRDVVTRAILDELLQSGEPCIYLDAANHIDKDLATRFPTIHAECARQGIDIETAPIPVVPAAHYNCGGVLVDERGRTTLERLYAVGECSCTGVHGANRLASTSLLEGLLWGYQSALDIAARLGPRAELSDKLVGAIPDWESPGDVHNEDPALIAGDWSVIKHTMWHYAGIARSKARLSRAVGDLRNLGRNLREFYQRTPLSRPLIGLFHGAETANLIAYAALRNRRSHGCHYRID